LAVKLRIMEWAVIIEDGVGVSTNESFSLMTTGIQTCVAIACTHPRSKTKVLAHATTKFDIAKFMSIVTGLQPNSEEWGVHVFNRPNFTGHEELLARVTAALEDKNFTVQKSNVRDFYDCVYVYTGTNSLLHASVYPPTDFCSRQVVTTKCQRVRRMQRSYGYSQFVSEGEHHIDLQYKNGILQPAKDLPLLTAENVDAHFQRIFVDESSLKSRFSCIQAFPSHLKFAAHAYNGQSLEIIRASWDKHTAKFRTKGSTLAEILLPFDDIQVDSKEVFTTFEWEQDEIADQLLLSQLLVDNARFNADKKEKSTAVTVPSANNADLKLGSLAGSSLSASSPSLTTKNAAEPIVDKRVEKNFAGMTRGFLLNK